MRRVLAIALLVSGLLSSAARGDDKAAPSQVVRCPVVASKVRMDGALDDPAWAKALVVTDFPNDGQAPSQKIEARIFCDAEALYVGVTCLEPKMSNLDLGPAQRDGKLWRCDSVEIFLAPAAGDSYYQFICSAGGVQYDAYRSPGKQGFADPVWDGDWECAVRRDKDRWTAETRFPYAMFEPPLASDWGIHILRNDRQRQEWPAWGGAAHKPETFSTVTDLPVTEATVSLGVNVSWGEMKWGRNKASARFLPTDFTPPEAVAELWVRDRERREIRLARSNVLRFQPGDTLSASLPYDLRVPQGPAGLILRVRPTDAPSLLVSRAKFFDMPPLMSVAPSRPTFYRSHKVAPVLVALNVDRDQLAGLSVEVTLSKGTAVIQTRRFERPATERLWCDFSLDNAGLGDFTVTARVLDASAGKLYSEVRAAFDRVQGPFD